MADDKQLAYADSIISSHSAYFARGEGVRRVVRMSGENAQITINGINYDLAPNGRPLAIAMQFRAFASRQPKVTVTPKKNTDSEEGKAQTIERFLYGVPRTASKKKKSPYPDALFNYAETGRGILYTRFDETLAVQGKFPFRIKALDPLSCALHMGDDGLIAAAVKETYGAEALYSSLKTQYEDAEEYGKSKPRWSIPKSLRDLVADDPMREVETLEVLTCEGCTFYVGREKVYDYEFGVKGVPLDVGFGIDLPSSKPEEWGLGLIYPISGQLDNEWKLLNKETIAATLFTFPFLVFKDKAGNLYARHLKPSLDTYGQVEEFNITTPTPNFTATELLLNKIEQSIGRLTLAEVNFGEGADTQSGYQVNLLAQPAQLRLEDQLAEFQSMWERHYGRLLRLIEYYATEAMAKEMGAKDAAKYLSSFATIANAQRDPNKETPNRVALTAALVKDYDENDIEVHLIPEPPADENAKAQRIGLYGEKYPQKYIDKYVEKVENQQELDQMRREEELRLGNELWAKFELEETRLDLLEKDPQKQARWDEFMKAQGLDAQGNPIEEEPVPDAMGGAPPQDPMAGGGMVDPMMEAQLAAQMAGQLDPMGLGAGMVSPAQMGAVPLSPEEIALQQSFAGGV